MLVLVTVFFFRIEYVSIVCIDNGCNCPRQYCTPVVVVCIAVAAKVSCIALDKCKRFVSFIIRSLTFHNQISLLHIKCCFYCSIKIACYSMPNCKKKSQKLCIHVFLYVGVFVMYDI